VDKRKIVSEFVLQNPQIASDEKLDELVSHFVTRISKKPMPAWRKKLYMGMAGFAFIWTCLQYLHYEACREKYPNASGWVCLMQPK
jgi:hypothetical protein